jgi:hypothetical protein
MKEEIVDDRTAKKYKRKILTAYIIFFSLIILAWSGWKWLVTRPLIAGKNGGGIQQPLRKVLDINEEVYGGLYSTKHLVKEYPRTKAAPRARVNGNLGMKKETFDPATWKLKRRYTLYYDR